MHALHGRESATHRLGRSPHRPTNARFQRRRPAHEARSEPRREAYPLHRAGMRYRDKTEPRTAPMDAAFMS